MHGGQAILAIIVFLIPIFICLIDCDREIARLTSESLMVWTLLGLPYAWLAFQRGGKPTRFVIGAVYIVTILGGLALLPFQLVAINQPQILNFIDQPDAILSRTYWDRLEKDAWVLGPDHPYRPMVLFGRNTGPAYEAIYSCLPEFDALLETPDPVNYARARYGYAYLDRKTWQGLSPEQRQAFKQLCVRLVG